MLDLDTIIAVSLIRPCRSDVGVVNIYNRSDCLSKRDPKPIKVVNNLLTQCDTAKFNSTTELLALASSSTEKSVKLVSGLPFDAYACVSVWLSVLQE